MIRFDSGSETLRRPLAVVWALGLLVACGAEPASGPAQRPPLVEAVPARSGALPLEERVYGVVRAENQVAVRPEISAAVAQVLVRSGDAVRRGEVLVRLEEDEPREQLRSAEADVRLAEATAAEERARAAELETRVKRLRSLADDSLVSPQELETTTAQLEASRAAIRAAEARVEQARATVGERETALARTRVRSPVAGRVGESRVEVGMLVDPGTALFRVGNLDRVRVDIDLTEEMLARIRPDLPVVVQPRGESLAPIEANLNRVSPFLQSETFTTVGEIDLDNPDGRLRPGMFVTVDILYGASDEATLIPTSALWEDPNTGERGVFVVIDAAGLAEPAEGETAPNPDEARQVSFRAVRVLAEGRGRVGVAGVAAGEWVVIAGQHLLRRNMQDEQAGDVTLRDATSARIRPANWRRVTKLQDLQREDLLAGFLEKQRRIAAALGAEIPENEEIVRRILESDPTDDGAR